MSPGDGIQSVGRALDVLEVLAEEGGDVGLSDLAARTGLPYGTVHRLLRTLASRGYVRQNDDRKYALGAALLRLGDAAERLFALRARPYLAQLVDISGETANLAVLEGDAAVYASQVQSRHRLRIFAEVGRHVLPHCTAVGKILLAWRSEDEVERILRRTGLPRRTSHTITRLPAMLDELSKVRAAGYARDNGEEEIDVHCLAVPVWQPDPSGGRDRVVAAMSISGPASRIDGLAVDDLVERMHGVAAAFSSVLARHA